MADYDYDLIALGGGAAGLTAAGLAASFGAKTLLIEKDRLGGDCTWTGCVPSKTLLHAAHVAHQARTADRFGLAPAKVQVDWSRLRAHIHGIREAIYEEADSPEALAEFDVETAHGRARFTEPHRLVIETEDGERHLSFRYAVICTGSRARVPKLPGIDEVPFLTNHSLFEIETQPASLLVLGGGPVGVEMAQAFQRLGTEVTVVDQADRILPRDHALHVNTLREALADEGVRFVLGAEAEAVRPDGDGVALHLAGRAEPLRAECLLVAVGREANVQGIGLEAVGVAFSERGVTVDKRGRTSQKHIYAAGDVAGGPQLTHWSEHTARTAVMHALLKVPGAFDRDHLAWATFTAPELARVGASADELDEAGTSYETFRFPYDRLDRALTENLPTGEITVFATAWTGKILGASVLGERAGELITTYAVAMKNGVSLRQVADTVIPYPTYGLGARRAADQWYARKQFPMLVKGIQKVFGYDGTVPPPPDPDRIV